MADNETEKNSVNGSEQDGPLSNPVHALQNNTQSNEELKSQPQQSTAKDIDSNGSSQVIASTQHNSQEANRTFQPNVQDTRALRSAHSKITFAYIAGPLSLLIGGMFLGTIGLICAGLAYRKLNELANKEPSIAQAALKLKKSAKTALIICAVAFVLNGITMYLMYPIVLEMLQSGQYGEAAGSIGAATSAGTSAWG